MSRVDDKRCPVYHVRTQVVLDQFENIKVGDATAKGCQNLIFLSKYRCPYMIPTSAPRVLCKSHRALDSFYITCI